MGLVSLFEQLVKSGKITEDMCRDKDRNRGIGAAKELRDPLTNGQDDPSNRFAHRIIKIRSIFETLDEGVQAAQLGSWSAAGFYCKVRSETETSGFYTQHTYGNYLEGEDDTLDVQVALLLARYREQLLEKLVPQDIPERIHLVLHLKKEAQKELGLMGDFQGFVDDHEGYAARIQEQKRYRNLVTPSAALLREFVMEGGDFQNLIPKGEGYKNPDKMIHFIFHHIQDENPEADEKKKENIATKIRKRFERDYGESYADQLSTYYDGDYKITKDGVRALLYSLGYLERELGPLAK